MCSKRIFSNEHLGIDYINYNKIKNGCEILKSVKLEDNIAVIDKFKNYNTWHTLNTAYFKYIDNDNVETQYVKNLYSANQSFIDKKKYTLDEHNTICSSNNLYLYPYGNIINKREISPTYSTKIYICKWCSNKLSKIHIDTHEDIIPPETGCKKCTQLCENRKPLFI